MTKTAVEMTKEFQCPGCVNGPDPETCPQYKQVPSGQGVGCEKHVAGTSFGGLGMANKVALGMPKGFNKVGCIPGPMDSTWATNIRLWTEGREWPNDYLNVPVWAMEEDNVLFVRTFSPRVGTHFVDVIDGATLADVPGAINVRDFIDEID